MNEDRSYSPANSVAKWRANVRSGLIWLLGLTLLALLLGVGLAAAQFLPTAELASNSQRQTGAEYDFAMTYSLWPWRLITFFAPDFFGYFLETPNFEPANPLKTPVHIAPVWYFTPFYAMLRAVPSFAGTQVWGVLVMGAALVILFFLPWLDRSPVKSIRYKGPIFKVAIAIFVVSFVVLGYLGTQPATPVATLLAQIFTALYFLFFLLMPVYSRIDKTKPVPERVTQ